MADTAGNRLAGGPRVFLAAAGTGLPVITGETITWTSWTELPPAIKDVTIKPIHKTVDHLPVNAPHPTGSISTLYGIASIVYDIHESDLDAFNIALPTALLTTIAAGAGQVGTHVLEQPTLADLDAAMYELALLYTGPRGNTGWGIIDYYYRVKRSLEGDFKTGAGVDRVCHLAWDVFAHEDHEYQCHKLYESLSAAV